MNYVALTMVSNKDKTDITIHILDGYECRTISRYQIYSQDELYVRLYNS